MKHPLLLSLAAFACAAVSTAVAEELPSVVPGTVNFQGRLAAVDSKGALKPLTGVQRVDFRLCDSATSDLTVWERQFPVTCTENGSFNLTLDDGGTMLYPNQAVPRLADAFQGNERHFELSVEGYGTLAPRLLVTASPCAFQAQYAAKAPGGFVANGVLTVGGNATFNGTFSAASGEVNGNLAVTGGGTVSNLTVKGTLELPGDLAKGAIPVGGIVAWTQEQVPDGWAVCDGTDGTPDLRARFVMGANADCPAGTTGGEESVTLTLGQMPDHQHGYPDPGNSDTVRYEETASQYAVWTDYQIGIHYMDPAGEGNPHENRPPFYAVYYISREDINTHRLYLHEVFTEEEIKKGAIQIVAPDHKGQQPHAGTALHRKLLQAVFSVKPEVVSKVVDEHGWPLVVAHSTDNDFTVFRHTQRNDAGWLGRGFYFFGDRTLDHQYGRNVVECFLNVRTPYYISEEERNELIEEDNKGASDEFSQRVKDDGYDGVYFKGDLNQEWCVFDPSQIKSATDNVGTFDSASPDIRYQIAGRAGAERMGIRGLGDAEAMERSGATREDIWRETGWWRGKDGKWRVEIPDFTLSMETLDREAYGNDPDYFVRKRKLPDLIGDTRLFDAYPHQGEVMPSGQVGK